VSSVPPSTVPPGTIPPSTIKVTTVEPCGDGKVCITMELVVDVHRMAEVSSAMMQTAVKQLKTAAPKKKK
jgi:hypothetical protein